MSETPTLFQQAARIFDGWTDAETGLRVLRLPHEEHFRQAGLNEPFPLRTTYHQQPPFYDGGRKVLLARRHQPLRREDAAWILDLTTGELSRPFPPGFFPVYYKDRTGTAIMLRRSVDGYTACIWDLRSGRAIATLPHPDPTFTTQEVKLLADGRTAIACYYRGKAYDEPVHSRIYLFGEGRDTRLLVDTPCHFISHIEGSPTDPNLFTYDRWPTPKRRVDQVITLMTLDGSMHETVPLAPDAVRPGGVWGAQRDHYLWTPDGRRLASYVGTYGSEEPEAFDLPWTDHTQLGWHLSILDWRTGEDVSVRYPGGRWGGNFTISPDSRYIVNPGGPDWMHMYLIDIARLREGWNERVLCRMPETEMQRVNKGPFAMPHPLPDMSGVIFTAGFPHATQWTYLVEWGG